jgi:cysteinyl-tRNA synthetase
MLGRGGDEMHKSLGNDVSLRNVIDAWGREAILVFFLSGLWRKPIDFSDETMAQAAAQAESFRNFFRSPPQANAVGAGRSWDDFAAALEDDFNTPEALAIMHSWRAQGRSEELRRALAVFGLESLARTKEVPSEVVVLAEQRVEARKARDFTTADEIRRQVEELGWVIRDRADGFDLVPVS